MRGVILLVGHSVGLSDLANVVAAADAGELRRYDDELHWFDSDECTLTLHELAAERNMLEEEYEEEAPGRLVWKDWRFFVLDYRDAERATRVVRAVLAHHPRAYIDLHEFGGGLVSAEDFVAVPSSSA